MVGVDETRGDFYEEDETLGEIVEAFEAGRIEPERSDETDTRVVVLVRPGDVLVLSGVEVPAGDDGDDDETVIDSLRKFFYEENGIPIAIFTENVSIDSWSARLHEHEDDKDDKDDKIAP